MFIIGVGFGFYLLSILGLLLLIPGLLSSPRPPMTRVPAPPREEPRGIAPLARPQQVPAAPAPEPKVMDVPPPSTESPTYSQPLFPMPMFPSLSQMGTAAQPPMERMEGKQEGRDELLEVGAILAFLKLAFG